jgi:hypothetical protein
MSSTFPILLICNQNSRERTFLRRADTRCLFNNSHLVSHLLMHRGMTTTNGTLECCERYLHACIATKTLDLINKTTSNLTVTAPQPLISFISSDRATILACHLITIAASHPFANQYRCSEASAPFLHYTLRDGGRGSALEKGVFFGRSRDWGNFELKYSMSSFTACPNVESPASYLLRPTRVTFQPSSHRLQ